MFYFAFGRGEIRREAFERHPTARAFGSPGTSKYTFTRRSPQFGHFSRPCNWSSGNFEPRVHTNVAISSSIEVSHSIAMRLCRLCVSSPPRRHRARTRQPSFQASPRVWTGIGTWGDNVKSLKSSVCWDTTRRGELKCCGAFPSGDPTCRTAGR